MYLIVFDMLLLISKVLLGIVNITYTIRVVIVDLSLQECRSFRRFMASLYYSLLLSSAFFILHTHHHLSFFTRLLCLHDIT